MSKGSRENRQETAATQANVVRARALLCRLSEKGVNLKNKIYKYNILLAKWIYSGIVEELQFGTGKLWQTTGKFKENGKVSFYWFKEETGEGCFEQKFTGEQEFEVVTISPGLQAVVSVLRPRQGEI